jgi:hypothetical protein
MPINISIDQYCTDPSEYANSPGLNSDTKKYWSSLCELRKEASKQQPSGRKGLGQATTESIGRLIDMLASPESLEMMGLIMGTVIYYKQVKGAVKKFLRDGVTDETREAAEAGVEDGMDAAASNMAIVQNGIANNIQIADASGEVATEVGEEEATDFVGKYAVEYLFDVADFMGEALSGIGMDIMVLQLIGMVFDTWDPCHLQSQLDSKMLKTFTTSFNAHFRESLLLSLDATKDSYGHIMLTTVWPIEYYADRGVLLLPKKQHYTKIQNSLATKYYMALKTNSNDQVIKWKGGRGSGSIVSNSTLTKLEKTFALGIADQNTVVANWIFRWWPGLLAFLVLIIILFLFIKNKR